MNTPAESRAPSSPQVVAELGQIDYTAIAEEWLGDFLEWREDHGPEEHLAVTRELQPRRFRLSSPNSTVENLMIRSTNQLDPEAVQRITQQRGKARSIMKIGESFYRRGNFASHRGEIFQALADKGIDASMADLYVKLAEVINIIPESSLKQQGFSKLCRTIGGFAFLSALERDPEQTGFGDIETALRAGYDFGITYPLVDDLVHDSSYLARVGSKQATLDMNAVVEHLLIEGTPEGISIPENSITRELLSAFEDAKQLYPFAENKELYRSLLVLHRAQLADSGRSASVTEAPYQEQDYVPYIVKAAMTRIIPLMAAKGGPSKLSVPSLRKVLGLGLRTQLHDDFVDIGQDIQSGALTPFSPYFIEGSNLPDLHPAELFIDSLFYSLDQDYRTKQQRQAARVLLGTAAHAFRATDEQTRSQLMLSSSYDEVVARVAKRYPSAKVEGTLQARLDQLALGRSRLFKKFDVYMFDVQDRMTGMLHNHSEEASPDFKALYRYALGANAKRLRPALAYMVADTFGVSREKVDGVALAAELLHTASLVFDDLPGQDNASLRRGEKPSIPNSARAKPRWPDWR